MSSKLYIPEQKIVDPLSGKVLVTAKYTNSELEIKKVEFGKGKFGESAEYKKLNPFGGYPTLETSEGSLWQSNGIARYLATTGKNKKMWGFNAFESAEVDQWLEYIQTDLYPAVFPLWSQLTGGKKANKQQLKSAQDAIDKAFDVLNKHLISHTYLVGERVTVADIALASLLHRLYTKPYFKPEYQQANKHVTRWFNTISSQPQFTAVFGGETKKVKEEVVKFKFDMEAWKRVYMNAKDKRKEAFEWFWSNLDPQTNSIYFAEYKYPKELIDFLRTSNLTRGFSQRLEIIRRFGFGLIITAGEDKDHTIKCLFVFNGAEYPKLLPEVGDFENYEWKKADWEKDKARIEDYLALDKDTIDGIRIEDYRIFR